MTAPRHPARLAEVARLAFQALDYSIMSTGANTYRGLLCNDHYWRHEAIQAYARIEEALRHWRST
ncbi:hypothetical protein [Roseovarius amoyensis]|uniref:hypothetical protein n=1 Tax=Roseovarius amoyensis TaxID=2211448 RepID=UPI000DBE4B57|nr:hypothetical protein [Roseovarius amoyensis]